MNDERATLTGSKGSMSCLSTPHSGPRPISFNANPGHCSQPALHRIDAIPAGTFVVGQYDQPLADSTDGIRWML
jgi:hypothetical protein